MNALQIIEGCYNVFRGFKETVANLQNFVGKMMWDCGARNFLQGSQAPDYSKKTQHSQSVRCLKHVYRF